MTYDNFMMDKIVHQEIYKKRMLFVKQIQLGTPHSWYAGYLEIIPSDPPFWKQRVAAKDYEFFNSQDSFNCELGKCTFAGKMPYYPEHPMFVGFDTEETYYPVSKNDCVESLRKMIDFLDRKLSYENQI